MLNKESKLRLAAMILFFVLGLALVLIGWFMTGKFSGFLLMLLGVTFLLAMLFVYNAPYSAKKK